jgi:hypothetical protein
MSLTNAVYCRACRTALIVHTAHGVVSHYTHARPEFTHHAPDPVPFAAIEAPRTFCDFCSTPDPAFIYLTDNVARSEYVGGQTTRSVSEYWDKHNAARITQSRVGAADFTQNMGEDWTACDGCAELVDKRDLLGLIWRVTQLLPAKLTRGNRLIEVRARMNDVYGQLFTTIGERQPNPAVKGNTP